MDSFWIKSPEAYTSISNESKEVILHPFLADIINSENFSKILDYGCGDGSLMKQLKSNTQISLYDNSQKVLDIAEKNLTNLNPTIYRNAEDIPDNQFDCIILSLVIMTISSEKEIEFVLRNIYKSLKRNGISLIAITHPCFREYPFSTFHTSYTKKNFKYFNDGEPFSVTLEDNLNGNDITFTDFHWSLSHTLNMVVKEKLTIESIYEIKDKSFNKGYENPNFCPYMVINCRKL
jgi:SAM-dependent methyltransferase